MSTKFYFNEQSSVLSVTQYQIDIFIQIIIQNYEMVIFTSLSCEGLEDINLITKIIIYEHQLYVYLMSGTIRIKNTKIYKLTDTLRSSLKEIYAGYQLQFRYSNKKIISI